MNRPRTYRANSGLRCAGKGAWVIVFLVVSMTWTACGGGTQQAAITTRPPETPPPPTTPAGAIPVTYWGLHVLNVADYPVQVPYGQFRHWDTQAQWPQIETCAPSPSSNPISIDPCFNWATFDQETADLKANPFSVSGIQPFQITDTLYTLSRTPPWASTNPTDASCDGFLIGQFGGCDLPADINADGSGSNQTWKTWVTAIVTHANGLDDPTNTYLQTHAHVKYWEPWNEWYRNPRVSNWTGVLAAKATYAQMLRLTEDARCIITGKGTVHNFPSVGASTPCAQVGLDPNALIVSPSSASDSAGYRAVMQNFLYCNATGLLAPMAGSACNWNGQDWGSQAVDIIDFHLYAAFQQNTPEEVATSEVPAIQSALKSADLAKPLWNGEGSWGVVTNPNNIWSNDAYARAGFIPRMFALYWSAGIVQNFFYSYESFLFQKSAGLLQPEATAWTTTYNWLSDSTPAQNPFCQTGQFGLPATVYSCPITKAGGYTALLVWDPQYGPGGTASPANCTNSSSPTICGNTSITVPSNYAKDWIDITGTVHPSSGTLTVGANPILLEGQ